MVQSSAEVHKSHQCSGDAVTAEFQASSGIKAQKPCTGMAEQDLQVAQYCCPYSVPK